MNEGESWIWATLILLGAYHGINPGMGWLFAVALGMQERSGRAVARALPPIALGHGVAIGAVVALAGLIGAAVPLFYLKIGVAAVLFSFSFFYLVRNRHPRWGGMQVGFGDLTFWSFLMASAHGAGFMVLPVLFGLSPEHSAAGSSHSMPHMQASAVGGAWTGLGAVLVHTASYLAVTAFVAWVFYQKLGLALLRKAWINLDLIWAVALAATGVFTLLL
jgi:hypothetical protein